MDTTMSRLAAAHRDLALTMRRVADALGPLRAACAATATGRAYGPQERPAELTIMRVKRGGLAVYGYTRAP